MERPWKQTIEWRGACESALKLRAVWEGDRRGAKVSTGLGKAHRPGSQGGPAETWTRVERGTHLVYRKSECWKLSAYRCARRRSIPTPEMFRIFSSLNSVELPIATMTGKLYGPLQSC